MPSTVRLFLVVATVATQVLAEDAFDYHQGGHRQKRFFNVIRQRVKNTLGHVGNGVMSLVKPILTKKQEERRQEIIEEYNELLNNDGGGQFKTTDYVTPEEHGKLLKNPFDYVQNFVKGDDYSEKLPPPPSGRKNRRRKGGKRIQRRRKGGRRPVRPPPSAQSTVVPPEDAPPPRNAPMKKGGRRGSRRGGRRKGARRPPPPPGAPGDYQLPSNLPAEPRVNQVETGGGVSPVEGGSSSGPLPAVVKVQSVTSKYPEEELFAAPEDVDTIGDQDTNAALAADESEGIMAAQQSVEAAQSVAS